MTFSQKVRSGRRARTVEPGASKSCGNSSATMDVTIRSSTGPLPPCFVGNFPHDRSDPRRGEWHILEQLCPVLGAETVLEFLNHGPIYVTLAHVTEPLDNQAAHSAGGGHVLGRGALEDDLLFTDADPTWRTVGQIDHPERHLLG